MEFHGHVASVVEVTLGSSTTADLTAAETVIPVAEIADYAEGLDVLIADEVYEIADVDEGEETGEPTITLASGLAADVDAETRVDVWDGSSTVKEWLATVTDDTDGSAMEAPLTHSLIALLPADVRGIVGESVVARQDEVGEWWVVEVIGSTPAYDPGFIRTGGLGADTVVWAGTENGRRAQLDGIDGALEAFNDANEQTVNLDGANNYVEGTFATAPPGEPRVEIGPGELGGFPSTEVRLPSGSANEGVTSGGLSIATADDRGAGAEEVGIVRLAAPSWTGDGGGPPAINLETVSSGGTDGSIVRINADQVVVTSDTFDGVTMGSGSVGTGGFRDSVDARVAAATSAFVKTLLDDADAAAFLTTLGFSALAQSLAGVTTVPDFRTAILSKDKRPGVNNQTANYTIAASDEDVRVQINSTSNLTVTLPSDTTAPTLPTNFEASVTRLGTGTVTFVADAGVTIESRGGLLGINGRYGLVNIKKRGSNRWIIWGDLA